MRQAKEAERRGRRRHPKKGERVEKRNEKDGKVSKKENDRTEEATIGLLSCSKLKVTEGGLL